MATENGDKTLANWLDEHPGTMLYIAIMVTASVFLQVALAFVK